MAEVNKLITNKIDMCLISETKLYQSFPNQQFQIHEYKVFWRDRDKYSEGTLFYVDKSTPSKVLHLNSTPDDNDVILLVISIKGFK